MTKQEARKQLKCRHCVFLDSETEICLCGDPDSEDCPKEDVAPVRHGKWIENYGSPNVKRCSVCKTERWAKDSWWRYCPNCGAKIDGKVGEQE